MSAETKRALDEAIAAHIADDTPGAIVTGYVLMASNVTIEDAEADRTGYWREFADQQPMHTSIGLASVLTQLLRRDLLKGDDE